LENLKRRDHLEDLGIDETIKFEWISGKRLVASSCEHDNEPRFYIRREFLD
jgi:hypothetical protein